MSLSQNTSSQPEFSLYTDKIPGIPVGRIYIPHVCTSWCDLSLLSHPIYIIEEKPYMNGDKLVWFVASVELYRSLAARFPHRKYSANTEDLLSIASTFFSILKLLSAKGFTDVRLSLILLILIYCIFLNLAST